MELYDNDLTSTFHSLYMPSRPEDLLFIYFDISSSDITVSMSDEAFFMFYISDLLLLILFCKFRFYII